MRVLGVLPLWLNTILEQIVCGHGLQLAGRLDVVVQTARRKQRRHTEGWGTATRHNCFGT
jgi:hypothetical protein